MVASNTNSDVLMSKTSAAKAGAKASKVKSPSKPGRGAARAANGAEARLAELKRRLLEISDLGSAGAVLGWDQATYMPKGGAAARARQGATLSRLAHEKFIDPAVGKLLDQLASYEAGLPYASDDASLIRVARRDYEKSTKVPSEFVARWSEMGSASYDAWTRARPANDFATMRPFLEKAIDFSRQYAEYLGPYEHIADPLIDGPDEGMTVASVGATVQGAARRAGAHRASHHPAGAGRATRRCRAILPSSRSSTSAWLSPSASATTSIAAASTRRTTRSARG